jgi:hypothetical protein
MTPTQYDSAINLIFEIMGDAASMHELMHGARLKLDYNYLESSPTQALELAHMVKGLMDTNLPRVEQLILTLEQSKDLA